MWMKKPIHVLLYAQAEQSWRTEVVGPRSRSRLDPDSEPSDSSSHDVHGTL